MKSFIAALRTLVLPFGATTGRRIVLDGVNGRIQIYNAANALVMEIDDTGVDAYAAGLLVAQLDNAGLDVLSGGVNRVVLDSANGRIQVFNSSSQLTAQIDATGLRIYENGVQRVFLDSQVFAGIQISSANAGEVSPAALTAVALGVAPNRTGQFILGGVDLGPGGFVTTFIDKENPATPPLYKISTSQYNGTAQPVIDLTGDFFAPALTRVVADDYWIGDNGGSGSAPNQQFSMPRGIMGAPIVGTGNVGPTVAAAELTLLTAGAKTFPANRRIRLHYRVRSLAHTIDTDAFALRFKEGATTLNELSVPPHGIAAADKAGWEFTHYINGPSAGSHTYLVCLVRLTGTGTATAEAAATFPHQLVVEDIGGF
jgi:hypothetical protein